MTLSLVLLAALVLPAWGVQDPPAPAGPPRPGARPPRQPRPIGLDEAMSEVLARLLAIPRFEDTVEVRDRYQEALDRHLRAADLACEVTSSGPPGDAEMNRFSANPKPPSADLLAAGELLGRKVKGLFSQKKPRFFLYSVHREAAPERIVYVVRDGPVSEDVRSSVPGTEWELVDRFADRGQAVDALSRLDRGLAVTDEDSEAPRTLWAATGCAY